MERAGASHDTRPWLHTPEVRAKRVAAMKGAWSRPEVRAKLVAAMNRPEVRAKRVAAMNRPEVRAKRVAAMRNRPIRGRCGRACADGSHRCIGKPGHRGEDDFIGTCHAGALRARGQGTA